MQTKLFEVRDGGNLIPVLATKMAGENERETWLLSRAGFRANGHSFILLTKLVGPDSHYDAASWNGGRTLRVAHEYIEKHFDQLEHGCVIDVERMTNKSKTGKTVLPEPAPVEK